MPSEDMTERHGLLRDIDIRQLAALRTVARERSFGRAAGLLGYTQSAVSQQIATLERVVGDLLFERPGGPRPVEITPLGSLLLAHAEAILSRVESAETELELYRAGKAGTISIGTFQSVSVRVLPTVFQRLRAERPALNIQIEEMEAHDHLIEGVAHRRLDTAFLVEPLPPVGLRWERLFADPFVLLSRPESGLGRDDRPVSLRLLDGVPMISQSDPSHILLVEDALRRAGVDLNVVFRSADNAAVHAMVRVGMGHAVMPWLAVDTNDPGVLVRRLQPGIPPRVLVVAWLEERHPPPSLGQFVELTKAVAAELVDESDPEIGLSH
jgi:DNA-binding transcriptional LysR family regulator